jgi:hypothetical protein
LLTTDLATAVREYESLLSKTTVEFAVIGLLTASRKVIAGVKVKVCGPVQLVIV